MTAVLTVGDVIDDVLVRPDGPIRRDTDTPSRIERLPGGSAANTACWLAAEGVAATLVATVGAADLGRIEAELRAAGVAPRLTGADLPTGTIVVLSDGLERTMLTDRGANRRTDAATVDAALLEQHTHLHLTGHVVLEGDRDDGWRALLDRAAAAGLVRSVAPGSAGLLSLHGPERFRRLVAGVELLVASLDEARLLTGETDPAAAARTLAPGHDTVAITLGADGAVLAARGALHRVPARPAAAVDTTGAGDAWIAGLIAALSTGASLEVAGVRAAALAARAVGTVGARPR